MLPIVSNGKYSLIKMRRQSWSHDGSILAYGTSKSGSDWVIRIFLYKKSWLLNMINIIAIVIMQVTIKFLNMVTGKEYEETLEKVKFSGITWTHDNKVR